MADNKFVPPKGRMTIRKSGFTPTDPMSPTVVRENRRVRLWDFEPKPGSTIARLERDAYLASLAAVDAVEEHKAAAAKSGKFTPQGVIDDALAFALQSAVPVFKRGRDAIKAAKAEAKAKREKLKLREPDKSDVAGAIQRAQICDRLAAMSAKERDAFIGSNVENLDPLTAEAILTAPAWLSGVSGSHRELLTDKALQAQHGETVAELQELERAIEFAASAVETGRDEIRLETGVIDPAQFDQLAAPIEAKQNAAWLKKGVENGVEIIRKLTWDADRKTGSWTVATPEDIERGIYYANADEYRKDNPEFNSSTPARSAA